MRFYSLTNNSVNNIIVYILVYHKYFLNFSLRFGGTYDKKTYYIYVSINNKLCSAFPLYTFAQATAPDLMAESALLFDTEHGQILYEKSPDKKLHISTACKLMTALLALEKIKSGQKIPVSKDAVNTDGAILNLEAGEKYDAEDLLAAIMLTPANDAAKSLAEFVAEDTKKFVVMMNQKTKELNMTNTVFKNSTGLTDPEQYTTAKDMYLLLKYALKNPDFKRLFITKGIPFNSQSLVNSNRLIWRYEGAVGGKAGYNDKDRQSAVTLVARNNRSLVSIVLFSPGDSVWNASIDLIDYGLNNFMRGAIVNKGEKIRSAKAGAAEISFCSKEDVFYTYPYDDSNIRKVEISTSDEVKPPITKDNPLGNIIYTLKDGAVISVPLFSDKEISAPPSVFSYIKDRFKEAKSARS